MSAVSTKMLSAKELAQHLNVHRSAVYRAAELLPHYTLPGSRARRYILEEVLEYLKEKKAAEIDVTRAKRKAPGERRKQ